jgi:hypothetical protein
MRVLKTDYGVTHPYMTLAKVKGEEGEGRVLVDPDPSAQSGELWLPAMMRRPGSQERSPLILADHFDPPPPPPLYQTSNVKYCKLDKGERCNAEWHYAWFPHWKRRHHLYRWWDGDARWHETADKCKCRCKKKDDPVPAC